MYGKYVILSNSDNEIAVWVWGTPNLSDAQWKERAKQVVARMQ